MIKLGHYHLVGVAGVGMSALAELLLGLGCDVTGSDRYFDNGDDLPVIDCLQKMGVRFRLQDGGAISSETRAVVVSTAVERDNPELSAATRLRVPVVHRSQMLAQIAAGQKVIAIAGTSGKSTVTGMLGWILECLGADPTVANGAPLLNWASEQRLGSSRVGTSRIFLVEADESDKSLLNFKPDWTLLTNVSSDHFDLEETHALFARFLEQTAAGVVDMSQGEISPDGAVELSAQGSSFAYRGVTFKVGLPGRHNVENALSAIELCRQLGYDLPEVSVALSNFKGLWRRLELVGSARDISVIDDYAHNAAKIEAAWSAVEAYCRKVHCVWRPHGYGPLARMMPELAAVFSKVCRSGGNVYVLPVYDVGGTADRSVNSGELVARIEPGSGVAQAVPDFNGCEELLLKSAEAGDVVLCMGARDPGLPLFCRRLLERLHTA